MAATHCNIPRLVIAVICTFIILGLILHSKPEVVPSLEQLQAIAQEYRPTWNYSSTNTNEPVKEASVKDRIHALFAPIRHSLTDDYIDASGKTFGLNQLPRWRESLKGKVLIVDIDTREPNGSNEMLNPNPMNWESLQMGGGQLVSGAIMGHHLYSQIHEYDYAFFQAHRMEGYHDTWILPGAMRQLIETDKYQWIITMDADVTITHPEVPLEWLLNHWGATNNTSILMPIDQKVFDNDIINSVDSKGITVLNTGVVVVQNLPYTKDILDAWIECPNEGRYQGCGQWKNKWSHEQRVFSEYIRYDFNPQGDNIIGIPCDDAMGYPNMMNDYQGMILNDCNGNFFRHHTLNKAKAKQSLDASIMQLLTQLMHNSFLDHKEYLWYKEPA
ncbi:hypothetical protein PMIN04_002707 [Paraphaeosphaeria minitans]